LKFLNAGGRICSGYRIVLFLQPFTEAVAQQVRASVCGTEGRGFETHQPPSHPTFSTESVGFFFMAFFVYILFSEAYDRYYIGQTSDLIARHRRHNAVQELSTRPYLPWTLVCSIEKPSRSEAVLLEQKIKNLNHLKLKQFISKYGNPTN
jgi:putative endonuclease